MPEHIPNWAVYATYAVIAVVVIAALAALIYFGVSMQLK